MVARGVGVDGDRTTRGDVLVERGAADGQDELGVAALDGRDRVAGVDRPGEGLGTLDRQDLADLHHVEQRGDARRDILAGGRRGRDERVVAAPQFGRSEESRVGKECGSTCRSRWSQVYVTKKTKNKTSRTR